MRTTHPEEARVIADADYAGDDERGRRVYLTFCNRFDQIARIQPPAAPFILFIGGDSSVHPVELLFSIAENALARGAVYVLCWGRGAGRFEEVVDEAFVARSLEQGLPPVMTTSHEHESLEEALAFATTDAEPAAEYASDCRSTVVVFAENVNWYNEAHNCLEDLLKSVGG